MARDQTDSGAASHTPPAASLESLQAAAFAASATAIAITDRAGVFVWSNPAFEQLTGYTRGELLGATPLLLAADQRSAPGYQDIRHAVRGGAAWQGKLVNRRKDGTEYQAQVSISPISDQAGAATHFVAVAQDITESLREQAVVEAAIRASAGEFRDLADNLREVFFIMTPDPMRMTYISPAYEEVWQRSRAELIERPASWLETIHPDDHGAVGAYYARGMQGLEAQVDYRVARPDGSLRWIDARSFPVRNAAGALLRIVGIAEDVTARKEEERALQQAHRQLNVALEVSRRQAGEAATLTDLVDILQSCQSSEEAARILEGILPGALAFPPGMLCLTSASRDLVEMVASWGGDQTSERVFRPDECWALRRGRTHSTPDPDSPMRCRHVTGVTDLGHLCVPLAAQGETLGVLYLQTPAPGAGIDGRSQAEQVTDLARQAAAVGERISLALANLRLREVLRSQSIRDALTGLFNRRFMEESLEREIRRADRGGQQVALLLLDLDHFKGFNDTFGHQAGDTLLRALGGFLRQRTRGQDVICRYGGEEFAFILVGASAEAALKRAEILREDIRLLQVHHAGQLLGAVTLSIGIAVFPDHGRGNAELMKAADEALYRAKAEGRDRSVVAAPMAAEGSGAPGG